MNTQDQLNQNFEIAVNVVNNLKKDQLILNY